MLNTELGLKTVAGNANLYKKLLAKLLTQADETIPQINGAIEAQDQELATRTAHSLKGAAISLGAEQMSACAAQTEQAFKNSEDTTELLKELAQIITQSKAAIEDYLANNP